MRECCCCKKLLSIDKFYKDKRDKKYGISNTCKDCRKIICNRYIENNKEACRLSAIKYKIKKNNRCIDCNKLILPNTKRCKSCSKKGDFNFNHINRGEKHPLWKGENCKREDKRNDSAYCNWRLRVYKRDGYKCKINNHDCDGRIEAHHILSFTKFPELRYDINNGITLCKFHHPRKKKDEKKLIPFFQNIINQFKYVK